MTRPAVLYFDRPTGDDAPFTEVGIRKPNGVSSDALLASLWHVDTMTEHRFPFGRPENFSTRKESTVALRVLSTIQAIRAALPDVRQLLQSDPASFEPSEVMLTRTDADSLRQYSADPIADLSAILLACWFQHQPRAAAIGAGGIAGKPSAPNHKVYRRRLRRPDGRESGEMFDGVAF